MAPYARHQTAAARKFPTSSSQHASASHWTKGWRCWPNHSVRGIQLPRKLSTKLRRAKPHADPCHNDACLIQHPPSCEGLLLLPACSLHQPPRSCSPGAALQPPAARSGVSFSNFVGGRGVLLMSELPLQEFACTFRHILICVAVQGSGLRVDSTG